MRKIFKLVIVILLISVICIFACAKQSQVETKTPNGWSSVDNVFSKKEIDSKIKKDMCGPIKIGFSAKEVKKVMGFPDKIEEENYTYFYHNSPIFFNNKWLVQSWDNRYGNLYVQEDVVKILPGSHISEVFKEKGFPLRILEENNSYQMEYHDMIIHVNLRWNVEAIQSKKIVQYNKKQRELMDIEEFLAEFADFLQTE